MIKIKNINLLTIKDIKAVNNNLKDSIQNKSNFNQIKIKIVNKKIVKMCIKKSINCRNNKITSSNS